MKQAIRSVILFLLLVGLSSAYFFIRIDNVTAPAKLRKNVVGAWCWCGNDDNEITFVLYDDGTLYYPDPDPEKEIIGTWEITGGMQLRFLYKTYSWGENQHDRLFDIYQADYDTLEIGRYHGVYKNVYKRYNGEMPVCPKTDFG